MFDIPATQVQIKAAAAGAGTGCEAASDFDAGQLIRAVFVRRWAGDGGHRQGVARLAVVLTVQSLARASQGDTRLIVSALIRGWY